MTEREQALADVLEAIIDAIEEREFRDNGGGWYQYVFEVRGRGRDLEEKLLTRARALLERTE